MEREKVVLLPHQQKALEAVSGHQNAGFYLDMGLGKTFTGSEQMKIFNEPVNLVICQKSKIQDWMNHFHRFYGEYLLCDLTDKDCLKAFNSWIHGNNKVIGVINYELAWRRPDLLKLEHFTLMLDESSLIQNTKAKQTKFILKLHPDHVILLSGTPTSGKYENLWSQCYLLGWDLTEQIFLTNYVNWIKQPIGNGQFVRIVNKDDPYTNVERMKQKLKDHGAVFMKTEEVIDLPEQIFIPVLVDPNKNYRIFCRNRVLQLKAETLLGDTEFGFRMGKRKLCSIYSTAKEQALEDLLNSTKDRLIIFYNFTAEMIKIRTICEEQGRSVGYVNGSRHDDPYQYDCLLVQYQAGSYGLNLQDYTNRIIYYSLPDKAELFQQSQKRIHRLGQTQTCYYYMFMVRDSIETDEILPTLNMRKEWTDELFK